DERTLADLRPMDDTVVPDGGVLTDLDGVVRSPMQDGAVLDVRSAAHDDGGEVSAEDRSVPHRRVRLYDHAANERCGRSHESRAVDLGTVTLEFQLGHLLILPSPPSPVITGTRHDPGR